ncbi:MarR family winged helix-turn-helix transcriptional regulator [Streptomyces hokutonensis]|uniref:MarR family winged helix-turn-helix transcriptional regulator n=1 Tax=Streptomyces hokutonensis TaxID=1306990 RepID=UPI00037FB90F|nr:MarR family transcriptional regulator [Streptomyces hokutonensis]
MIGRFPRAGNSDTHRLARDAILSASDVVEMLDLLWEHARDTVTTGSVSSSQLRLMCLVDRNDGIRMRALGELLRAAPPSVSRLCDRLQAAGFIERLPSPDSGREVTLRLTTAGRRHLQQIRAEREGKLTSAIEAMPLDDRLTLVTGLAGLHSVLAPVGQSGLRRSPAA